MSVSNMELLGAGGETSFMNHLACCQFTIMTIIIGFCDSVCVCVCVCVLVAQSCPTLCDTVYCSPPGSSVHGVL